MAMIIDTESEYWDIANAITHYSRGAERIKSTARLLADHLRAKDRHAVDSLMWGSIASGYAGDALLRELIVHVFVAAEIVMEKALHIKHRDAEHAAGVARKQASELFQRDQDKIMERMAQRASDYATFKTMQGLARVESNFPPPSGKRTHKKKKGTDG